MHDDDYLAALRRDGADLLHHCGEVAGAEWLVHGSPDGWQVVEGAGAPGAIPSVTVTAPATELDLLLWRRRGPAELAGTIDGDPAVLAAADLSGD